MCYKYITKIRKSKIFVYQPKTIFTGYISELLLAKHLLKLTLILAFANTSFIPIKSMKKFLLLFLILFSAEAKAQDTLSNFNQKRNQINQTGMKVLGGWALANIVVGSIAFYRTKGTSKYFNQMNVYWNIINIGLAGAGFYGAKEALNKQFSLVQSINEQHKTELILLFNAGLDVAYVVGGLYLGQRGINKNSERWRGYGNAVILQGAFLLLFDGSMFAIQNHHGKTVGRFLNKIQVGFNGKQVGLTCKL